MEEQGAGSLREDEQDRVAVLARRMKAYRERKALTQAEFAEACGVSRAMVANIERVAYYPGKRTRRRLAEALGVPVEDLFEAEGG